MIKTIHVHIGGHKTGSTFIQESLGKIRDFLLVRGCLYPLFEIDGTLVNNHSVPFYSIFCKNPEHYRPNVLKGYDTPDEVRKLNENHKKQLSQQLEKFDGETLIISGEDISTLDQEGIQNLKEYLFSITNGDAAIKIIFFCRHPITYARSHIQEVVKGGQILEQEMENYASFARSHYQTRLGNFLSVFSHDDISVIKYEDAISHTNGLLGAFLSVVGMDPSLAKGMIRTRRNESLSYESILLANAINRNLPMFVNNVPNPLRSGYNHDLMRISGKKFTLDSDFNQAIWATCSDDIAWLCKNFRLPEYKFSEHNVTWNDLWNIRVLEQLNYFLYRMPIAVRDIILSQISADIERYGFFFSQSKIAHIEKFLSYYRVNKLCNIRFANIISHIKIFGATSTYDFYRQKLSRGVLKIYTRIGDLFSDIKVFGVSLTFRNYKQKALRELARILMPLNKSYKHKI
jgi:hypothetical protein